MPSGGQVTQLRESERASTARAKQAEEHVRQHKAHLEVVEKERAEERAEAEVVARRAAQAHAMALKRGREAKTEAKEQACASPMPAIPALPPFTTYPSPLSLPLPSSL